MKSIVQNICDDLNCFSSGEDTSIEFANEIELALDNQYPQDEFIQETVVMLAMYRPEGGEFFFDTFTIQKRLQKTLRYLNAKMNSH